MASSSIPFPQSDSWQENWAFIDWFISYWLDADYVAKPVPDDVAALESKLGIVLPPSAKCWYALTESFEDLKRFSWRWDDPFPWKCWYSSTDSSEGQNRFAWRGDDPCPSTLHDLDSISLLQQAEGDVYWGIKATDLIHADPPVMEYLIDYDSATECFEESETRAPIVSAFALDYLLSYSDGPGMSTCHHDFDLFEVMADFCPVQRFGNIKLWLRDGVLVHTHTGGWLRVLLRDAEAMHTLPEAIKTIYMKWN